MPCTTLLVGKKATFDGSTIISRTDDGHFDVKKIIVVEPENQPRHYVSEISHLEIDLPDNPMRYTSCPSVDTSYGIWAATGINAANVGMSATETITSNSRVLSADPKVRFEKGKTKKEDKAGGIGEEDIVVLVLPYIHSAREGVIRLGQLLETYGTYESNGIAFNDRDEIWWMETIGGHHWIARRVADEEVVIMPNQFGLDHFDLNDAFGEQKENMCSADLREFMAKYHIDCNNDGTFNPRLAFGSHSDSDHVYNTPRGWYMARYFCPRQYVWDGDNADFTPESDDIPWSLVPERKVDLEEVKYILSSYYQGTEYNPYGRGQSSEKGKYRPIGISRTGVTGICQIRNNVPDAIAGVEWICFASNAFNAVIPLYTNVSTMPKYVSRVTMDISTDNFYWTSRLLGVLTDAHYGKNIIHIERYQTTVLTKARTILNEYDAKMIESGNFSLTEEANAKICDMAQKETMSTLKKVELCACEQMKNGYNRFDN